MYLQNLKIAITLSVIILSINSTSAVRKPSSIATDQTQRVYSGNLTRNIDVSGMKWIKMGTHNWNWCGSYYVYMEICGLENHKDAS